MKFIWFTEWKLEKYNYSEWIPHFQFPFSLGLSWNSIYFRIIPFSLGVSWNSVYFRIIPFSKGNFFFWSNVLDNFPMLKKENVQK